jgi:peptidoglycan/LPS O-acetylase OafA/YrhL
MKDKIFFNNLDALRFFAFFLVFLAHAPIKTGISFIDSSLNSFGAYGVYLFFVISGFLITYLLFVENRKFNQINLSSFFVRRLLRIWPLYFFILAFEVIYFWINNGWKIPSDFYYYLTFLGNFDRIYNGYITTNQFVDLGVLWTIGIEEQFYILIPVIFYFLVKIKNITFSLILIHIIILISKVYYIKFFPNQDLAYRMLDFNPLCAFDMISLGCLLASFTFVENSFYTKIKNFVDKTPYFIFVFFPFIFSFGIGLVLKSTLVNHLIIKEILGICFCLIVLKVCFTTHKKSSSFNQTLLNVFNGLGKISYGLYIYHCIVLYFVSYLFSNGILITIIAFIINIFISKISFKYFESPILKFKKNFIRVQTR